MKGYSSSIRTKLGLVVVAGVVPAVILASLASAWRETHRRVSDAESELSAIAEAIAVTLSLPLSQDQPRDVTRALGAVGRMPNVRYARVVDTRGALVAQFGIGIVLSSETPKTEQLSDKPFTELIRLRNHAFSVPVISGGRRVGRLDLVADVSEVGRGFWSAMRAAFLSATGAALLGLLIAMPILAVVTEPLRTLTAAMRRVRQDADFSRVENPGSRDETGILVESFNEMIGEIQTRDAKLESHRAGLEQAVRERTTELQIAKQAAEAANTAKTDFLAAMSHEIRTPMHGMLVTTELLQTTTLDDRQRRFAEMITKSGQSLLAIVNDILDLSKIEAGRMDLERIAMQPVAIAEDVAELFGPRAQAKGITIDVACADDVPEWITGDPIRLNQIVSNLVGNAIKFTQNGRVTIEVSVAPEYQPDAGNLRFIVSDTGIGIEPENLERIFEAFVQASQDTSRRFGGTGIGLAISRRLATAMGGTLTAESRVGEGSRFICSIPAAAVDAPVASTVPDGATELPSCTGMRVLAADDNPVNRAVLEASLARLGIEVVSVENGVQALDAFRTGRFDLVFMDCSMPVMDGYTAAREIRLFELHCGNTRAPTPIVALTAHVIGKSASDWQSSGMSDYLAKPFTLSGLTEVVLRWRKEPGDEAGPERSATDEPALSPPASMATALLDFDILDQIGQMDPDGRLLARLVRLYREQGSILGPKLVSMLEAGDRAETSRLAHALKSMSLSIGAQAVAEIVSDLEAAANLGAPIDGAAIAAEFTPTFEATLAALDGITRTKASAAKPGARQA